MFGFIKRKLMEMRKRKWLRQGVSLIVCSNISLGAFLLKESDVLYILNTPDAAPNPEDKDSVRINIYRVVDDLKSNVEYSLLIEDTNWNRRFVEGLITRKLVKRFRRKVTASPIRKHILNNLVQTTL